MTKNDLAEKRTDWAADRTLLANERTFAGWMRTGMAAVGVAIGLKAVFGSFEPTWMAKAVATLFLVAAVFIFGQARRQAGKAIDALNETAADPVSKRAFTLTALTMTVGSIATGAILWAL